MSPDTEPDQSSKDMPDTSGLSDEIKQENLSGMEFLMAKNKNTGEIAPLTIVYGRDFATFEDFRKRIREIRDQFNTEHNYGEDGYVLEDRWAKSMEDFKKGNPELMPSFYRLADRFKTIMQLTDTYTLKRMIMEGLWHREDPDSSEMHMVVKAIKQAEEIHQGQTKKEGTPYILHPLRVAVRLMQDGYSSPTMISTALLHDVMEDSDISELELRRDFGVEVSEGVKALSKRKPDNSSIDNNTYYGNLTSQHPEIRIIKIYDRIDNLESLNLIDDMDFKRTYLDETRNYVMPLAGINPILGEKLQTAMQAVKIQ